MRTRRRPMIELYGLAFLIGAIGTACAEDAKPAFPVMAPIEQYREASASAEIELARTAAPTSISGDASVLVLGNHGYETAVKGKNGFVCLVWRSWAATLDDPDFWNPKFRAPICFNPAAVRTVLPAYLERTKWALAGASKAEIEDRTRAELASNRIATPDARRDSLHDVERRGHRNRPPLSSACDDVPCPHRWRRLGCRCRFSRITDNCRAAISGALHRI